MVVLESKKGQLINIFPKDRRMFWNNVAALQDDLEEIRIRVNAPIIIKGKRGEIFLDKDGNFCGNQADAYVAKEDEAEDILRHICNYSIYAYEDELRNGFVTVSGGHRIGVAGQVVLDNSGRVRTIKHITCMNIRISHQIIGAADELMPKLYSGDILKNTLIISPPGCGKTTILRDIVRQVSDGNNGHGGMRVGLVDERSEIAGSYMGIPQNDVGIRTDVLDACPKTEGMIMLLRSMAPKVLAVDELGDEKDLDVVRMALSGGCKVLATVHGQDLDDVNRRFGYGKYSLENLFDICIVLGRNRERTIIVKKYDKEEENGPLFGWGDDSSWNRRAGI